MVLPTPILAANHVVVEAAKIVDDVAIGAYDYKVSKYLVDIYSYCDELIAYTQVA